MNLDPCRTRLLAKQCTSEGGGVLCEGELAKDGRVHHSDGEGGGQEEETQLPLVVRNSCLTEG